MWVYRSQNQRCKRCWGPKAHSCLLNQGPLQSCRLRSQTSDFIQGSLGGCQQAQLLSYVIPLTASLRSSAVPAGPSHLVDLQQHDTTCTLWDKPAARCFDAIHRKGAWLSACPVPGINLKPLLLLLLRRHVFPAPAIFLLPFLCSGFLLHILWQGRLRGNSATNLAGRLHQLVPGALQASTLPCGGSQASQGSTQGTTGRCMRC